MGQDNKEREKFASRLGFILVSAGCAVGLGNVWKFPYICGENGGAAFILLYLLCLVALGLPILICEFCIGRGSRKSVGAAFTTLAPENPRWSHYKWFGLAGNYLLMMFYTMVAGWMLYYVYVMASGQLRNENKDGIKEHFSEMLSNPETMIFWTVIVIVVCIGVCSMGLQNGIEKVTKVMMLLLISLMIVMAVNSVLLKGSREGLEFYLVPDFGKIKEHGVGNVVFDAMTHAFFTLSVGIGSMEIFGSYQTKERRVSGEAVNVLILDTFVALMAGIIILPACFAYGVMPDAGPSLLFITLPNVFNKMPGGNIWGICFFVFMSFAALSTVIAVFESIISIWMDIFQCSRKKSVIVNFVGITLLSLPAILGFNLWSGVDLLGNSSSIMDVEDFLVSYNILPLGSLLCVLFCVRKNGWGYDNLVKEANEGVSGLKLSKKLYCYFAYVIPTAILVIYFKGYYDFFKDRSTPVFLMWMGIAVLFVLFVMFLALGRGKSKKNEA